jgi:hypothetical protein
MRCGSTGDAFEQTAISRRQLREMAGQTIFEVPYPLYEGSVEDSAFMAINVQLFAKID